MTPYPGKLIALEGIDGAGKTTQVSLLSAFLRHAKETVVSSKEPTDGKWGQKIRKSATEGRLPLEEEVEAFIRDRREHVDHLIGPGLRGGAFVLVDRYYLSTAAYQGALGIDPESLMKRNEEFAPLPDAAFILEIDVDTALGRISRRGYGKNLFELAENLRAVKMCFESLDRPYITRVDGNRHREIVFEKLLEDLVLRSIIPTSYLTPERINHAISTLEE